MLARSRVTLRSWKLNNGRFAQCANTALPCRESPCNEQNDTWLNHLVGIRRATDLEALDSLIKGAGAEAREVLEKFRENHAFDPEKILATELHIALDENFVPIENPGDHSQKAEYEGTLDLVMLDSLTDAEIHD